MALVLDVSDINNFNELNVRRYESIDIKEWDSFVSVAVNTHFLFYRGYMDYHSDRFEDYSLMIYTDSKLVAVFPASIRNGVVTSHGGLTFGGLLYPPRTTATDVIATLHSIVNYYKKMGLEKIIYKPSPWTYHSSPCEADLYALHAVGAVLLETHLATTIDYASQLRFSGGRKNQIQRAKKNGVTVSESNDWNSFVGLLSYVLEERHSAAPVHTAKELELLSSRFPKNIKMYVAFKEDELLAAVVLFITPVAVHTQYMASSDEGCYLGALDLILSEIISMYSNKKGYFCFGVSTEDNGNKLNTGLLYQKESFGGRSVVHNIWEIVL